MSEDEKLRHYEMIREIVKEEVQPIVRNINIFFTVSTVVFLALIGFQISVTKDVQAKATTSDIQRDYLQKLEYYQIEEDEHRLVLGLFSDSKTANFIFGQVNDNIKASLGFKYTTRGGGK